MKPTIPTFARSANVLSGKSESTIVRIWQQTAPSLLSTLEDPSTKQSWNSLEKHLAQHVIRFSIGKTSEIHSALLSQIPKNLKYWLGQRHTFSKSFAITVLRSEGVAMPFFKQTG